MQKGQPASERERPNNMWRHLRVIDDCRVKDSAIRKRHQSAGNHENPQASGRIIRPEDNGKSFLIKSVLARLKIYLWAAVALIFIESSGKKNSTP
jgi:hypothetical protein